MVLVEPKGPLNVGSIARLCANFDVNELRIVSPKCDIFSLEARKMALKGHKFIEKCQIFKTIEQAIFDCDLVLATSGRIETRVDSSIAAIEDVSKWISSLREIKNLAILFGREDRGLTNSELLFAQKIIYIPTSLTFSSSYCISLLNLLFNSKINRSHIFCPIPGTEQINFLFCVLIAFKISLIENLFNIPIPI